MVEAQDADKNGVDNEKTALAKIKPVKIESALLLYVMSKPTIELVTGYIINKDVTAVTINPLYKAPSILLLFPNLTNQVPIIEVMIQAPPIAKGKIIKL